MSKYELFLIDQRLSEIEQTLDLCDPIFDADVLDNLEYELSEIIALLEVSRG